MQSHLATALSLLSLLTSLTTATSSSKRGLVWVDTKDSVEDASIWTTNSDLTWYYNYAETPTPALSSSNLEFVPMLWGASESTGTTFLDSIKSQLSSGSNITHVLSFNEPDGTQSTGGSNVPADTAAAAWLSNIAPLRSNYSILVGLPAVTGSPDGFTWLQNFNSSCYALAPKTGCPADFIPIHWYGNFEGLASHMGQVRGTYPTLPIWITEYADPDVDLSDTQSFYNESSQYFDRIDYVQRYSYFGSFRSSVSNVGANVAMLTGKGKLTDIGSWYLGGSATGNKPHGAASSLALDGKLVGLVAAAVVAAVGLVI